MCANRKCVSLSKKDKVQSLKHLIKGSSVKLCDEYGVDSGNDQWHFVVEEQISVDRRKSLTKGLVHGVEHRNFISEQQIISIFPHGKTKIFKIT
jgi:hypothetical protein